MDTIDLFLEDEQPSFDYEKRRKEVNFINEYFREHKEELGRVKVISPDPNAGEGRYRITCEKQRIYIVVINDGKATISNQDDRLFKYDY